MTWPEMFLISYLSGILSSAEYKEISEFDSRLLTCAWPSVAKCFMHLTSNYLCLRTTCLSMMDI